MSEIETHTDYMPIQSLDIEAETKITFDLYVNLPLNNKYILYRRAGGQLETQKLHNLTQNNISNFYINKKDYHEFVKYVALRMRSLVGVADTEANRRMMAAAAKAMLSSTLNSTDPATTKALMNNLNDISKVIIESVLESSKSYDKRTFQRLLQLSQTGTDFQKHPVNVASLAVLLTLGIGYSNDRILSDTAMAALLHDIGLSKLPTKIISSAHHPDQLTQAEQQELFNHPKYSIDILREKGIRLSQMAQTLILQHHEEFNGLGYPFGLRGFVINELAQVLKVADELDRLLSEQANSAVELRIALNEMLDRLYKEKTLEPSLVLRIRTVLN